jgi:PPOX class probable F420-dependent enzyme
VDATETEVAAGLERAREFAALESGLAVVAVHRTDGSTHVSVINAGVLKHSVTDKMIVAFVSRGTVKKLAYLRQQPRATVLFRSGWQWVAVEGDAELAGPDDPLDGLDAKQIPRLLREVYAAAAGGNANEWAALDDSMAAERHTAVLIRPIRTYPKDEPNGHL